MRTKYIIFIIFFFIFIINDINAQFSQQYNDNKVYLGQKYALATNANLNWVALTEFEQANNFRRSIIAFSTDNNGVILSANSYKTADSNYSISSQQSLALPNGDLIIAGTYSINNSPPYYAIFISIDSIGNLNWAKKMDISNIAENILLDILSDGSILCNLRYNNGSIHNIFFKLDAVGNFSDFYQSNNSSAHTQNILTKSGSFDLLLSDGNFINISNDLQNINWQRKYNHIIGSTINRAANGDYLLATAQNAFPGHMTVSRLDSIGNIIWSKYIETSTMPNSQPFDIVGFHFISETTDNKIVISANSEGGLNGSMFVTLDANGNYISNRKSTSFINKMTQPINNEYIYGGFVNYGSTNTSNFVINKQALNSGLDCDIAYDHTINDGTQIILSPDSLILSPTSAITTQDIIITKHPITYNQYNYCNLISSIDNQYLDNENTFIKLYPNPVSNILNIESTTAIESVSVYNISGKILSSNSRNSIDMSQLPKGVYLIRITTSNKTVVKRIVKE